MRPRWVQTRVRGDRAIFLRREGLLCLIRYVDRGGGYAWAPVDRLIRRKDLDDKLPEPWWLVKARASNRPPRELWALLDLIPPPEDLP